MKNLFNIFAKEAKNDMFKEAPIEIKNTYPKEVLEIHHEFEIASDKILEEANSIINAQPKVNESKVSRLSKFGFNQVKEVQEAEVVYKATEMSKEMIETVQYFKQNYPYNKFITEEQVKHICHKYNLVCGDVSRFRGFVPDKNLKEIENFKLIDREKNSISVTARPYSSNTVYNLNFYEAEIKVSSNYYHIYKIGSKDRYNYAFQSNNGVDFYGSDSSNVFGYSSLGNIRFSFEKSLKICAPIKDMDISGLELKEGYKLEKIHIPDPIVLQPVKSGFLILTMWADETFDPYTEPMLRNDEILN